MSKPAQPEAVDVVVLGAGPGGAGTALCLAKAGLRVALVERERFPRFHVGESLAGTAGDFVREHGLAERMDALGFPEKPGVRFVGRGARQEFYVPSRRASWQVRRADFDRVLLEAAQEAGARLHRGRARTVLRRREAGASRVCGVGIETQEGGYEELRARFVVDATGQASFLSRQEVAGPRRVDDFARQIGVYSHFEGICGLTPGRETETVQFYAEHLHWAWLIPLGAGKVSLGGVLPVASYKRRGADLEAVMDWCLSGLNPELARMCAGAERVDIVRATRNYSYEVEPFAGPGWLCVGDAHRFVDPIFSFGVSFALTEARAAAQTIAQALSSAAVEAEALAGYAAFSRRGQSRAADLLHYFWRFPAFFSYMFRGPYADDLITLLTGDCFTEEPLPVSTFIRESLESIDHHALSQGAIQEAS